MTDAPLTLGWREWIALPGLHLPAIEAKVDTGARTSALHALEITPFGPAATPQARFQIQPDPDNPALTCVCAAPIVDRRPVTSSNGQAETRYVIETDAEMAGRRWRIQITLTDRSAMSHRMLLGREAMGEHVIVRPAASFLQPVLSYAAYG